MVITRSPYAVCIGDGFGSSEVAPSARWAMPLDRFLHGYGVIANALSDHVCSIKSCNVVPMCGGAPKPEAPSYLRHTCLEARAWDVAFVDMVSIDERGLVARFARYCGNDRGSIERVVAAARDNQPARSRGFHPPGRAGHHPVRPDHRRLAARTA